MTLLIASDLDQTLIFSPRAAARGPARPSRTVEVLGGEVISLLSQHTEQALIALQRTTTFVPTTTRTQAQYERIDLPGRSRYAIVASGGRLLVDGAPDRDWATTVADRLAGAGAPLGAVQELFAGWADRDWLLRLRDADGLFLVTAVQADLLRPDELAEVTAACAAQGWRALHQGRKLYVLPRALDKAAAVAHVADRVRTSGGEPVVVLAAGDTLLDWPMLLAADRAWLPAGSELDRLGLTAPHVTRTGLAGLAAAEQIVDAWRAPAAVRAAVTTSATTTTAAAAAS